MSNSQSLFNPLEVWSSAGMATAAASLEMAAGATAAAMSFWTGGLGAPATPAARPAPATRLDSSALPTQLPGFLPSLLPDFFPAFRSPSVNPSESRSVSSAPPARSTSTSTGRSWYRAPYRSPFDPLFWVTPGHPIDHIGDWLAPMMAMGSTMMGSTMMGSTMMRPVAGMPAFGLPAPMAARTGFARAPAMDPWSAWAQLFITPAVEAVEAASEAMLAGGNVVDFGQAFSNYRTAGGHASAQIVRVGRSAAVRSSAEPSRKPAVDQGRATPAWPWELPFVMFGWLPR